jgi:hypothetical protein
MLASRSLGRSRLAIHPRLTRRLLAAHAGEHVAKASNRHATRPLLSWRAKRRNASAEMSPRIGTGAPIAPPRLHHLAAR